jgi:hypothetical protein
MDSKADREKPLIKVGPFHLEGQITKCIIAKENALHTLQEHGSQKMDWAFSLREMLQQKKKALYADE